MSRALALLALATLAFGFAQSGSGTLVPGTLLVATEKLGDPNFAETVVFITRREEREGIMGVVLNRPLELTVAKAFPQIHGNADPVYEGGPVSSDAVQGLLRSSVKPADAEHIVGDIYSVVRKASLEKSISERLPASKFRVYLGYAGWGPGQLENEVRQGAWSVVRSSKYVFDGDPASLWERLDRDSHSQVALLHATMKACRCSAPSS